jgi:hypothetical protein
MDSDQTAMGLPPVKSTIFVIAHFDKTWVSRKNKKCLYCPFGEKVLVVCMYVCTYNLNNTIDTIDSIDSKYGYNSIDLIIVSLHL